MYTTGIIHTSQSFHIYTDTGNNLQCIIIHGASPCFNLPLLTLLCSPLLPFLLTWNPPSCDRIHPPRSQVACELASPFPPFFPTPPPSKFPGPLVAQRLTKTTSGPVRRLLSGTLAELWGRGLHTRLWSEKKCLWGMVVREVVGWGWPLTLTSPAPVESGFVKGHAKQF